MSSIQKTDYKKYLKISINRRRKYYYHLSHHADIVIKTKGLDSISTGNI